MSEIVQLRASSLTSQKTFLPLMITSQSSFVSGRGMFMHALIYGMNVYSELNSLRQQYKENKYTVFYFSKALSNIELFVEFFFEIMHERAEPLIAWVELAKCLLRLREYKLLVAQEKINTYVEMETYQEFKRMKEIRDAHFTLERSKKRMPKIKNFKHSSKLEAFRKQKELEESKTPSEPRQGETSSHTADNSENEELGVRRPPSPIWKLLTKLVAFVRKALQSIINFLFSSRYHLDDIIVIVRPFIFVYCVM